MNDFQKIISYKAIKGGMWQIGSQFITNLFDLIRIIILARLLMPSDFGLYGIALLVIIIISKISKSGFNEAIIQKSRAKNYLDTAWTIEIIRGIIIFLVVFILAPIIGKFLGSPEAILITRVCAISILIRGFINIGILYFRKDLLFYKQFVFDFISSFGSLVVTIISALILKNAWALVLGLITKDLIQLISSYIIHNFRPKFEFNINKIKNLFNFGRWILKDNWISLIAVYGDNFFITKFLGSTYLGLYQMSFKMGNLINMSLGQIISNIGFPVFSKFQNNKINVRKTFFFIFEFICFISIPLTVGIVLIAPEFVQIFLGKKWIPIIPILQILTITSFFRLLASSGDPLFRGIGIPKINFYMNLIRIIFMIILIYPLSLMYGLVGVALNVLIGLLLSIIVWWYNVVKTLNIEKFFFLKISIHYIISTLIMSTFIIIIKKITNIETWTDFTFIVISSAFLYLASLFLFWKHSKKGIINYLILFKKELIK